MKNIIVITSKEGGFNKIKEKFCQKKSVMISYEFKEFYANSSNIKIDFNIADDTEEITSDAKLKLGIENLKGQNKIDDINKLLNANKDKLKLEYKIKKNTRKVEKYLEKNNANKLNIYHSKNKDIFLYECKLNDGVISTVDNFITSILNNVKKLSKDKKPCKYTLLLHRDDIVTKKSNEFTNKELTYKNRALKSVFNNNDRIDWDSNNCFSFSHNTGFIYNLLANELKVEKRSMLADKLFQKLKNFFTEQKNFRDSEQKFFNSFDLNDNENFFDEMKTNLDNNFKNSKIF